MIKNNPVKIFIDCDAIDFINIENEMMESVHFCVIEAECLSSLLQGLMSPAIAGNRPPISKKIILAPEVFM